MYNTVILNCSQYHVAIAAMYIPIFKPCFFFFVSFTSWISIHSFSMPLYLPSGLVFSPSKKKGKEKKRKFKGKNPKRTKSVLSWKLQSDTVSCDVRPFYPDIFTCKCSLLRVIGLVWGLVFCHTILLLSCGVEILPQLQVWSIHMLLQILDGVDVGVANS